MLLSKNKDSSFDNWNLQEVTVEEIAINVVYKVIQTKFLVYFILTISIDAKFDNGKSSQALRMINPN